MKKHIYYSCIPWMGFVDCMRASVGGLLPGYFVDAGEMTNETTIGAVNRFPVTIWRC